MVVLINKQQGNIMKFDDYEKFIAVVQPLEEEELVQLGFTPENQNELGFSDLEKLKEFCKNNPEYHIATITSDGDDHDVEGEFCYTISNSIRYVNRMSYLLCKGDSNEEIFLEEVDSYN